MEKKQLSVSSELTLPCYDFSQRLYVHLDFFYVWEQFSAFFIIDLSDCLLDKPEYSKVAAR